MRRRSLMAMAAAALCAGAAMKAAPYAGVRRLTGGGEAPAAAAVAGKGPSSLLAQWGSSWVPMPNAEAEPPQVPPKVGAELARSYRDDVCGCTTKACWRATSASYRSSVGLAVAQADGEGPIIDAAFRAASTCIRRIYAADALENAAREPAAEGSPLRHEESRRRSVDRERRNRAFRFYRKSTPHVVERVQRPRTGRTCPLAASGSSGLAHG